MTVRSRLRLSAAAAMLAPLLWLGTASTASAQADCGQGYRILRGDTLAGLARACNVSPEELRRANPQIDWDLLRIGAPVFIPDPGPRRPGPPPRRPSADVYVIEPGDTLGSVAAALGVSVGALLDANPGLSQRDLIPGREIRLGGRRDAPPPPPIGDINISVRERSVEPGGFATVELDGLPPRAPVTLRAGPEGGRGIVEASGRADRRGRATIEIDVPNRARGGERWQVEALDPRGRPVARTGFRIGGGRERRGVTVSGLLTREGIECPALRSDDGELYTLSGRLRGFRAGDSVTVTGRVADRSACQQGTTIEVERIEGDR